MANTLQASLRLRDEFTSSLQRIDRGLQRSTQSMDDFKQSVQGQSTVFQKLGSVASSAMAKLNSSMGTGFNRMKTTAKSATDRILMMFSNFGNRIRGSFNLDPILSRVSSAFGRFRNRASSAMQGVGRIFQNVGNGFNNFKNKLQNGLKNVSSTVKQVGGAFKQFGGDMQNAFNKFKGPASEATGMLKNMLTVAGGIGISKAVGGVTNTIKGMLSGGFNRINMIDTAKAKLQALGNSAEDIASIMDSANDSVTDTAFRLEDAVTVSASAVAAGIKPGQELTTYLNRIADASAIAGTGMDEMGSIFNKVATGGIAQADELNQMADRGIPIYQMLADSMGIPVEQIKSMASEGKVGLEEFVGAFESLEGAAVKMGTATFQATIDNIGSSINRMGANFMNGTGDATGFFDVVKPLAEDVLELFRNSEGAFAEAGNKLGQFTMNAVENLDGFIDKGKLLWDTFKETGAVDSAREALSSMGDALGNIFKNLDYEAIATAAGKVVDAVAKITTAISDFIANIDPDTMSLITKAMIGLVGAVGGFKVGKGLFNVGSGIFGIGKAFGNLGGNLFDAIFGGKKPKAPTVPGMPELPAPITPQIPTPQAPTAQQTGLAFLDSVSKTASSFLSGAKNIALIFGVIKLIEQLAEALKQVNEKVSGNFLELAPKLANMGIALTGMGTFVAIAGKLTSKNPAKALMGLGMVAGISANIILAAEAIQQVNNKVPENINSFASKVANMAIAIGAMSGLIAIVGILTSLNPIAAVAGLAMVAMISGELILSAEAMKQVNDKVPDDIESFANKVANMAIAIGAMSGLVAIIGTFTALNPIGMVAGLVAVSAIAFELMLVAEALKQFNDKVPENMDSVATKIDVMTSTIQAINEANLGSVLDVFGNLLGGINIAVITNVIDQLIQLADDLQRLATVEVPSGIEVKMFKIQHAIGWLEKSTFTDLIESLITTADLALVSQSVETIIDIADDLKRLESVELNAEAIKGTMDNVLAVVEMLGGSDQGIFSRIGDWLKQGIDTAQFTEVNQSIDQINDLANKLTTLQAIELDGSAINFNLNKVKSVVETLSDGTLIGMFGSMIKAEQIQHALTSVNGINNLTGPISELGTAEMDASAINFNLNKISAVVERLSDGTLGDMIGSMLQANQIQHATSSIEALNGLVEPINQLAVAELDPSAINFTLNTITGVVERLSDGTFGGMISSMITQGNIERAQATISAVTNMANSLKRLGAMKMDNEAINSGIESVSNAITKINSMPEATGDGAGLQTLISNFVDLTNQIANFASATQTNVDGVVSSFNQLSVSATETQSQTQTALSGMESSFKTSMDAIVASTKTGMSSLNNAINAGMSSASATARRGTVQIVAPFRNMRNQLYSAGTYAMSGLSAGINAGSGRAISAARSVANRVTSTISSALKIQSPSLVMMALGAFVAIGLANGILSAEKAVENASADLAMAAQPTDFTGPSIQLATAVGVTREVDEVINRANESDYSGTRTVQVDDRDISRMHASLNKPVNISVKQTSPQVTLNIETQPGQEVDVDDIIKKLEEEIIRLSNEDLS